MEKRKYKNEYISLLGFGGLRLPLQKGSENEGDIDEDTAYEMIDYAINHGINYFDTVYGYHHGKSELLLGEALSKYPREKYNLATKIPLASLKSEYDVERIFSDQLNKCRVKYFDFYLLHNINKTDWDTVEKCKVYAILKEKQDKGFIRHLGFSFHDTPELLQKTVDTWHWDFAQIQLNYMDWKLQNAKEQYRILKEKNIPVIVMEPVRGGTLAKLCGKSAGFLQSKNPELSIASWAIRYAASFPEVLTVLSGMSNMEQLRDNIKTMSPFIPLNEGDYKVLEDTLAIFQKSATIPCTGCGYCSGCPKGIAIPSIFAIYNTYKAGGSGGNRSPKKEFRIRYNILRKDKQAHCCVKCNKCIDLCPQHIDIPGMMDVVNNLYKRLNFKNRVFAKLRKNKLLRLIYGKLKREYVHR